MVSPQYILTTEAVAENDIMHWPVAGDAGVCLVAYLKMRGRLNQNR